MMASEKRRVEENNSSNSEALQPPIAAAAAGSLFSERFNERLLEYSSPQKIEMLRESCIFNIISHGAMGFLFGGALGLFLSGMTSTGPEAQLLNPDYKRPMGIRAQAREIFGEMAGKTWKSAKNFGLIAAMFTGFECAVETYRAKHDIGNTLAAGCATGGVLGAKAGPKSALFGCVGFAAFSAAVEHFLQDRPNTHD